MCPPRRARARGAPSGNPWETTSARAADGSDPRLECRLSRLQPEFCRAGLAAFVHHEGDVLQGRVLVGQQQHGGVGVGRGGRAQARRRAASPKLPSGPRSICRSCQYPPKSGAGAAPGSRPSPLRRGDVERLLIAELHREQKEKDQHHQHVHQGDDVDVGLATAGAECKEPREEEGWRSAVWSSHRRFCAWPGQSKRSTPMSSRADSRSTRRFR